MAQSTLDAGPLSDETSRTIEFALLVATLSLATLIALSGVPGRQAPEAGNGSEALELGWAEQQGDAQETPGLDPAAPSR